uniref:NADH-ubiquinone oxidoreductase chain 4L n=1 Tax=Teratoscincus roborowskii TaxID=102174 RepID=A0A7L9R840_9SAUR|nr:NADH dehydrogenase subunit 4L [Teratoscincus roborowskii]QOL12736.1 NADH dehydrogenase subunit 4L [Teratoscincus roborowskii]
MAPALVLAPPLFTMGMTGLTFHRKHLVSALLCIEGMLLTLYMMLTLMTGVQHFTTTSILPIILLTLAACEASTGLALLVASSRTHASDHLKNLNLLKC